MIDEPVRGGFPDPSFYSLPGIEQARAILRGLIPKPPLSHLLGIVLTQVGPGSATATMPASPWFLDRPNGTIHLPVLLEVALRMAALTGAGPGMQVSTATVTSSYLRPPTIDAGGFVARARVVNSGRTYTLTDAVVEDAAGRPLMQSTASMLIRPIDAPPPPSTGTLGPPAHPAYPTPDPYLRPFLGWALDDAADMAVWIRRQVADEEPLSPIFQLLGGRLVHVDEGSVSMTLRSTEWLCGPDRVVSSGAVAFPALFAVIGAATTVAPPRHGPGVLAVNLTFVRTVEPDGREVLARGSVVYHAGDLVVASVDVTDADGNPVALGQLSAVLRPTSAASPAEHERPVLTVLFTDLVGSTEQAQRLGDARWKERLDGHHTTVRKQLQLFKGREVKTTGDGFLATFDSPGRAVQCARVIRDSLRHHGLEMRAGLHTGECELSGGDVAGIAVHIAARIEGLAEAGEILVSGTVRDLVAGSGLRFADRGRHPLKGIEGDWAVFALEG